MRLLPSLLLLLPLLILASQVAPLPAVAQSACTLDPVTLPLFDATPPADIAGALATPAAPDDPGSDADAAQTAEFATAIDVLLPCIDSADLAFSFSVFTERYLAAMLADASTYQPDVERAIADSADDEDGIPLEVLAIEEVRIRDDGRMSGRVTLGSEGAMSWSDILVLANIDGIWLIDDVIPVSR